MTGTPTWRLPDDEPCMEPVRVVFGLNGGKLEQIRQNGCQRPKKNHPYLVRRGGASRRDELDRLGRRQQAFVGDLQAVVQALNHLQTESALAAQYLRNTAT